MSSEVFPMMALLNYPLLSFPWSLDPSNLPLSFQVCWSVLQQICLWSISRGWKWQAEIALILHYLEAFTPCRVHTGSHMEMQEGQQRGSSVGLLPAISADAWLPHGCTGDLKSSQAQKAILKYLWFHAMAFQMPHRQCLPCTRAGCWVLRVLPVITFLVLIWWQQKEDFCKSFFLTFLRPLGNWKLVTREWTLCSNFNH